MQYRWGTECRGTLASCSSCRTGHWVIRTPGHPAWRPATQKTVQPRPTWSITIFSTNAYRKICRGDEGCNVLSAEKTTQIEMHENTNTTSACITWPPTGIAKLKVAARTNCNLFLNWKAKIHVRGPNSTPVIVSLCNYANYLQQNKKKLHWIRLNASTHGCCKFFLKPNNCILVVGYCLIPANQTPFRDNVPFVGILKMELVTIQAVSNTWKKIILSRQVVLEFRYKDVTALWAKGQKMYWEVLLGL